MFGLPFLTPTLVKWGGIALAVLAVCIYIGVQKAEISHYKSEYDGEHKAFVDYRSINEANHKALKSAFAALTLKLKQQGIEELKQLAQTKEANDAAIRALNLNDVLNARLVSVLNALAKANANGSGTPGAKPGHDGRPDPATADNSPYTDEDLALTWSENNTNAFACILTVHKWQNFWKDFVNNVRAIDNANRP